MHALTKYPSGGGDVLMGSVITRDDALHERLKLAHMRHGLGRGRQRCRGRAALAAIAGAALRRAGRSGARAWRSGCSRSRRSRACCIRRLPARPGTSTGRACAREAAGLFSVVFDERYSAAQVRCLLSMRLKLFKLGYSWAGPVSLAVPYDLAGDARRARPRRGTLVRFSIGLEAADDLIADLDAALHAVNWNHVSP